MTAGKPKGQESPLKLAFISDIHLYHNRVPTERMLRGLKKAFPDNRETGELDAIFIGGDLFDQTAHLDSDVRAIEMWMADLLYICKRWNIVLRVLEGTPSHDRGQSAHFEIINDISGIGADCKYVETLSVEHLDTLGISVLYVPDEWRLDPEDTWADVKQCLSHANLQKVDYAVMHGLFEFQLPAHLNLPTHRSERYLDIVNRYISIGHHHAMRVEGRIFAQGSFDRLAHGEEGSKGHIRVLDQREPDRVGDEIVFVENAEATPFVTVDVPEEEEALKAKLSELSTLPAGSHVRLACKRDSEAIPRLQAWRTDSPHYAITFKYLKDVQSTEQFKAVLGQTFVPTTLTPNDVRPMMGERLARRGLSSEDVEQALRLVEDCSL